ncbi:DNA polymerase III subunit psi [Musicola keenii]|uniref:DNA polymerase III subunit psi n=1 Tax=Musicola keenii TaxID=2884250 RepID=UPI0017829E65|nr:DNA polymerase III subunit psi [Musicola keenii]
MASRRDWLLQQLGITQWVLRRPAALRGEIAVNLPPAVRLLIVADPLPANDDPLLLDVLRSLALAPEQSYSLTPQQAAMLPEPIHCHFWWQGVAPSRDPDGVQLTSPALAELSYNAGAKRALWQQIYHHEHNFHSDRRRSDGSLPD